MKYVDETERSITTASRILRVPNVSDVPEVVRELMGSPHPKLTHLRCVRIDLRALVDVVDASSADRPNDQKVFVKAAHIRAHYEVPS